jgi:hypothetical protein
MMPGPIALAACPALSADRDPITTLRPALASRRAIAAPSFPVPPMIATVALSFIPFLPH